MTESEKAFWEWRDDWVEEHPNHGMTEYGVCWDTALAFAVAQCEEVKRTCSSVAEVGAIAECIARIAPPGGERPVEPKPVETEKK